MKIGLTLSGGGYRATAYHLGVIRAFRELGMLSSVNRITSVSGGSVVAAHLVLHWNEYVSGEFDTASVQLINVMRSDVRGRVLRRIPWYWALASLLRVVRRLAWPLGTRLQDRLERLIDACRTTACLEREYRSPQLFGRTTLEQLSATSTGGLPRPHLEILGTNTTTATLCSFSAHGFLPNITKPVGEAIGASVILVSEAVAASSSFPGFFVPWVLRRSRVHWDSATFAGSHYCVTDGGVYDNIGITPILDSHISNTADLQPIIISDASGFVEYDTDPASARLLSNLFRTVDITMLRTGQLYRKMTLDAQPEEEPRRYHSIDLWSDYDNAYHGTTLVSEEVDRLKLVRTDCDAFSDVEIRALCQHGYAAATRALAALVDSKPASPAIDWSSWPIRHFDVSKWPPHKRNDALRHSATRKTRLWSWTDPASYLTAALLLVAALVAYRYVDVTSAWKNEAQHFDALKSQVKDNLEWSLRTLRPKLYPTSTEQFLNGTPEPVSYASFNIVDDDRTFLFDYWVPVSSGAERHSRPSYVVMLRTIRLQKTALARDIIFEYRTYEGDDVRLELWPSSPELRSSHTAKLLGETRAAAGSSRGEVIVRQIKIDVGSYALHQEFIIGIKATFVNGFGEQDWAGVLVQPGQRLRRVGLMLIAGHNTQLHGVSTTMATGDTPDIDGIDCAQINIDDASGQYYYWVLINPQTTSDTKVYKLHYELRSTPQ